MGPAMHLVEILRRRTVPNAGLLLALTRRCPLSCAHCSTRSTLTSEEYSDAPFRRVVASFTPEDRPDLIYMSGGEALLHADLVHDLARSARDAGARSAVLSGMYFAREGRAIPAAVRRAIGAVDHFAASLDVFHEREVGRAEVFAALRRVRDWGPAISFQVTGLSPADPYLAGLVGDIRREFADEVPVLVDYVQASGRAQDWLPRTETTIAHGAVIPCALAHWPLVHYDGTVFGCCSQALVARLRPAHLTLGQAGSDTWPVLRARAESRPLLRAIRLLGPVYVRDRFASATAPRAGYCETCVALADEPATAAAVEAFLGSPAGQRLESVGRVLVEGAGAGSFTTRLGAAAYADLVGLGYREPSCAG
jgi:Radical SAM superfamily